MVGVATREILATRGDVPRSRALSPIRFDITSEAQPTAAGIRPAVPINGRTALPCWSRLCAGVQIGLLIAVLGVFGPGCAQRLREDPPGPGVPRIADLRLEPTTTTQGCSIRVTFHFEDSDGDLVSATGYWVLIQSNRRVASGTSPLPLELASVKGQVSGSIVTTIVPEQHGVYWYSVQAEDAAGQRSNVLKHAVRVGAPLPWRSTLDQC